jgi:hypothetical protein
MGRPGPGVCSHLIGENLRLSDSLAEPADLTAGNTRSIANGVNHPQ